MIRKHLSTSTLILTLIVVALGAGAAQAQDTQPVNYQWTAPTTGAPVHHYVIEHSVDGGAWTVIGTADTNTYTLTANVGESHRIRVAGVDADNRMGTFSVPSEAYVPQLDPPGQPGQPIVF
jgi:hypothetical protein